MNSTYRSARKVGAATSQAIHQTAGFFVSTVVGLRRGIFQVPGKGPSGHRSFKLGASPGIEAHLKDPAFAGEVKFSCTDIGEHAVHLSQFDSVDALLAAERPTGTRIRWINIDGLDPRVINSIGKFFGIDTLTAEDILNVHERPKFDVFNDHLLVTARQIYLKDDQLKNEKLSILCFKDTLISFQEIAGDVFDPVRRRLESPTARFRTYGTEYLMYALLDCISDHLYPLLERYDTALEELEAEVSDGPGPRSGFQQRLFALKRELSLQRRILWPMREVIDGLCRAESPLISNRVKTFLRDVHDQVHHQLDLLDNFRETCSSLHELYHSTVSNRMNEIMKVLTIMASFFIPITFIAGVYGMNFEYIPELQWRFAYPLFWAICASFFLSLAWFFYRKGWLGKG